MIRVAVSRSKLIKVTWWVVCSPPIPRSSHPLDMSKTPYFTIDSHMGENLEIIGGVLALPWSSCPGPPALVLLPWSSRVCHH